MIRTGFNLPPIAIHPSQTTGLQSPYSAETEQRSPFGPPLRPNAPVSTGHNFLFRNRGPNFHQHGFRTGASIPGPTSYPVFTSSINPYRARMRSLGRYHGIPGVEYLPEDILEPPYPWKEGDPPITPAQANALHAQAYDEAAAIDRKKLESFRSRSEEKKEEEWANSGRRWKYNLSVLDLQLQHRLDIYEKYVRHQQQQQCQSQAMHQGLVPTVAQPVNVHMQAPTNHQGMMAVSGHGTAVQPVYCAQASLDSNVFTQRVMQPVHHHEQTSVDSGPFMPGQMTMTAQEAMAGWRPLQVNQSNPNMQRGPGLIRREMDAAFQRYQALKADSMRYSQAMEQQRHMAAGVDPKLMGGSMPSSFPAGGMTGVPATPTFSPPGYNGFAVAPSQYHHPQPSTITSHGPPQHNDPPALIESGNGSAHYNYPPPPTVSDWNLSSVGLSDNRIKPPTPTPYGEGPTQHRYPSPSPVAGWNLSSVGLPNTSINLPPPNAFGNSPRQHSYPQLSTASGSPVGPSNNNISQNTDFTSASNQEVGLAPSSELESRERSVSNNGLTTSGVPAAPRASDAPKASLFPRFKFDSTNRADSLKYGIDVYP